MNGKNNKSIVNTEIDLSAFLLVLLKIGLSYKTSIIIIIALL